MFDLSVFKRGRMPSLSEQFRKRVDAERGTGVIRSPVTGNLIVCIWTECEHHARREHQVAIREGAKPLFYFFCSDRHRKLWLNSVKDMGNLPTGDRGTIS